MNNNGRRDVLRMLALAGGGAALIPGMMRKARAGMEPERPPAVPWPYRRVEADQVAERAHAGYYRGACCYGAFDGIVGELRDTVGYPYSLMPTEMMVFGEGGVAGVGSLCGALIGASSAIFLVAGGMDGKRRGEAHAIIRELFNWYQEEALPTYRPRSPKFEIAMTVAHSPLCHVSVSRWCKATGLKSFSAQRSERCARLTASVARYAVELLNNQAAAGFRPVHLLSSQVQACRGCHDQGGSLEDSRGLMDCAACHITESRTKHP